jgi:hypothetical protein
VPDQRPPRSRIVVETSRRSAAPANRRRQTTTRNPEPWIAISIIIAATLATFFALFITSRPFDPETSSLSPQQAIPAGPALSPSPKASASTSPSPQVRSSATPTPSVEAAPPVDDASIQARIDSSISTDPVLSKLDVSTLVENGKVTIVGSVKSVDLKQRIEKTVRTIKGVSSVDNQLVVNEATPPA